jgi:hypothetical protein
MKSLSKITINVQPLKTGWALECSQFLEAQLFKTGGEAERNAIRLAAALAKVGWCAKVVIHDLGGGVAGLMEVTPGLRERPQWRRAVNDDARALGA